MIHSRLCRYSQQILSSYVPSMETTKSFFSVPVLITQSPAKAKHVQDHLAAQSSQTSELFSQRYLLIPVFKVISRCYSYKTSLVHTPKNISGTLFLEKKLLDTEYLLGECIS